MTLTSSMSFSTGSRTTAAMIKFGKVKGRSNQVVAFVDLVLWTRWYEAGSSSERPRLCKEFEDSCPARTMSDALVFASKANRALSWHHGEKNSWIQN